MRVSAKHCVLVALSWGPLACQPPAPRSVTMLDVPKAPKSAPVEEARAPIVEALPSVKPLVPADVAFVTTHEGRAVVVLDTNAETTWGTSEPVLHGPATGLMELSAEVDVARLPETHRLAGRSFAFYRGNGLVCSATLGPLHLAGKLYEPGMDWSGSPQHTPPASPLEISREAWVYASKWLVADVSLPAGCERATWARDAAASPPVFVASVDLPTRVTDRVAASFASLDEYASAESGFESWMTSTSQAVSGPWATSALANHFDRSYAWGGKRYVATGASVRETCSFAADLFAIYRIDGDRSTLVTKRESVPDDGILVDLNGDGRIEDLVGSEGDGVLGVQPFDDPEGSATSLEIASPGCPC